MKPERNPRRAVALLSGGLDSAVTLAIARRAGFQVYALTIDYGQRHRVELDRARLSAESLGAVAHRTMSVDLRAFGRSSLVGDGAIPKGRSESEIAGGIPSTYVPARNTVFLSLALAWAEALGATDIFIGVNAIDYSGYPDCRPEFLSAFESLAERATKAGVEGRGKFRVHAPLVSMGKAEIIRRGGELRVDFAKTISCYDPSPQGRVCGACDSCELRAKGFREAGLEDPALGA
ncbi:MAG: 7-cyano-7-deazaguanine synthase QueC [Vicinamibacteria bacterium]